MKFEILKLYPKKGLQTLSLKKIITKILNNSSNATFEKNILFVNDIAEDIMSPADENVVIEVIDNIIKAIINNTYNDFIWFTAKKSKHEILLHIKSNKPSDVGESDFKELQTIAEKIGGHISREPIYNDAATIIFSFFNPSVAA